MSKLLVFLLPLIVSLPVFGQLPDLIVERVDVSQAATDSQTLAISGHVQAKLKNIGGGTASGTIRILAFEDRNNNGRFDSAADAALGQLTTAISLGTNAAADYAVAVTGTVLFRGNRVFVHADSENTLAESNEGNNLGDSGQNSQAGPVSGPFAPSLKWSWTAATVQPTALNVMSTPAVVDLNRDGTPEVVFGSTASTGSNLAETGYLRVLDGRTGALMFTSSQTINTASSVAVGDIDGDGKPEVIACSSSNDRLLAFEDNGDLKWTSSQIDAVNQGSPSLADLNNDGTPEIVIGRQVLSNTGSLMWTGAPGSVNSIGALSFAADVDLDGSLDIVAGNKIYSNTGALKAENVSLPAGYAAVGNFDTDPQAEIVHVADGFLWLLEHTLAVKWGPIILPGGGRGGPPTVADFDGDGQPEIGIAGATRYVVFETDGSVKWQRAITDGTSNVTGSSVFDFESDGKAEVIYADELALYVFRGSDGAELFRTPKSSCTWFEYPLVADVDADGSADIVAVANNNCGIGSQRGVYVYQDPARQWVPTRKIWNQYAYSITNVNDDGTIPRAPQPNWLTPGLNNFRLNTFPQPQQATAAPDLVPSWIRANQSGLPASVQLTARVGNGGVGGAKNLILNGEFEVPDVTGYYQTFSAPPIDFVWQISTGGSVDVIENSWVGASGSFGDQSLDIDYATSIWQSFRTVPGRRYAVSFYYGHNCNAQGGPCSRSTGTVEVASPTILLQQRLVHDAPATPTAMNYAHYRGEFDAGANLTTLTFRGDLSNGSAGFVIDRVEVFDLNDVNSIVSVSFHRGDPANGGTPLGTTQTSKPLAPGEYEDVSITWNNPTIGSHPIIVVVDPRNLIREGDETNNKAGTNLLIGVQATPLVDSVISRFKDKSADVIWGRVTGAASYNVYRRTQTGAPQRIRTGVTATSITDTGLTNGQTYYYTVRWVNTQGTESGDGTEASATPTATGSTGATPPTILSYPLTRGTAGTPYAYQLRAGDPDAGEVLTYSLVSPPGGMTVSPTGLIQWMPGLPNAGYNRIQVRVQDKTGRFATQSYSLFIDFVVTNNPPAFTSTPIISAQTGVQYGYTARAIDPDTGDLLTYSLVSGPAGMSINGAGLLTWTPLISQVGTHAVTVRVQDLAGLAATQSFSIAVTRLNRPPQIISFAPATGRANSLYSYQVAGTDPDLSSGDTLSFGLNAAPAGMTVTSAGFIQWTPTVAQQGAQQATVRVTDSGGLSATQTFTVNVLPPNQQPIITSIPFTKATVSGQYTYAASGSDPDGDALTWSVAQGPVGLGVTPTSGLVQWVPTAAQQGSHTVTIRATDPLGLFAAQTFTIVVGPQDTTNPAVTLLTPASGATLANDVTVMGTVTDDNLQEWTVSYRVPGDGNWVRFGSGTANVTNSALGTFRASLLANNPYRILLTGRDAAGNSNSQEIEVQVDAGEMKLGDFTMTFEDMRIPGLGLPVAIQRTYDTKQPQNGGFGPHWALSFSGIFLRRDVNYNVFATLPSGRRVKFQYTPTSAGLGVFNTRWTAESGSYDTLENTDCPQVFGAPPAPLCNGFQVWDPQNWILRTKEGYRYFITSGGGVRRMEDRNGNWMEIASTGIATNTGQNIPFTRDGQGRITEIREPSPGTGVNRYEYDAQGRLSRYVDPAGAATRFVYENASFPNYLTKIEDPLGRAALRNVFDAEGRLVAQCDANGNPATLAGCARFNPNAAARTQTIYNARGFRTDLILDGRGNILNERRYTDGTSYLETVRTYDANNNMLTERDPAGNVKTYSYDARGNRLTERDPGGRVSTYTYNTCDKVATETDPAGRVTNYTYDAACNLTEVRNALNHVTRYAYNSRGQRTQFTDPNGNSWTWAYNAAGFLTSLTDPFGKATVFTFGPTGDLLSRVDRMNRQIAFQYDSAHRLTRETWGNGRVTNYGYDAAGQLLTAVDADSALTMTYDANGRLRTVDNVGTPGAPRVVMTYGYDANGNVTQVADSLGGVTDYSYDGLDRLARVTQSGTGVQPKRVDMEYDASSLLKAMRRFSNLAGTAAVANTLYEYDCGGCPSRLTAIRHRKASDNSVIHDLTYTRDAVGNILQMVDADGTHNYSYDAIRRLLSAGHSNAALQPNEFYTYDAVGNRLTSHLSNVHAYSRNRLVEDQQHTYLYDDEGNQVRKTVKATGAYTEYVYDFRNRMTGVVERSAGGVETGRHTYGFDAINRRIFANEAGTVAYWGYDGLNPVLKMGAGGVMVSRRMYSRNLDQIAADQTNAEVGWLLTDQVGTTRELVSNFGGALNHYVFDSFGSMRSQTNATAVNDLGFTGRENYPSREEVYFRARVYSPSLGRFSQPDLLEPYRYEYADLNPVQNSDRHGLSSSIQEAILLRAFIWVVSNAVTSVVNRNVQNCGSQAAVAAGVGIVVPALVTIFGGPSPLISIAINLGMAPLHVGACFNNKP